MAGLDPAISARRQKIPGSSPGMTFSLAEDEMIYELRVYHCVPGRLPDLLKRFDTITLKIWNIVPTGWSSPDMM